MRVERENNGWSVYMSGNYQEIKVAWFLMRVAADRFVADSEAVSAS